MQLGAPQLPLKGILIDVPEGKVAELSVLNTEVEPYSGYRIYPVPEDVPDNDGGHGRSRPGLLPGSKRL